MILIVEDQPAVAKALELLFELEGLECRVVRSPEEALADLGDVDLVIQDMNFSPGETSGREGVALFRQICSHQPELPVLMLTAFASVSTAVDLMKKGAADYLEKPWDDERLLARVRTLLRLGELERGLAEHERKAERARQELAAKWDLCGLIYRSEAMHEVISLAVRVARSDLPVLISGANGTGKEKIAELLVANSARADKPFIRLNVGALPEHLIEAELFGAEVGAFTGATKSREGRFDAADGGTLLLDEIGTLPAAGQAKLLRVLESSSFERLGSSKTRKVDVRVLAATNADLEAEIAAGRFREDLYYRLNAIELRLPGLAERPEDIEPLAKHFLRETPSPDGVSKSLSAAASAGLLAHPWPGNVRELSNSIQRAVLTSRGAEIEPADLALRVSTSRGSTAPAPGNDERSQVAAALERHDGVVSHAADELGITRQALYRRMRRYGLSVEKQLRR